MAMAQDKEDKEMINKNLRKLAHHRVKQQVLIKSKNYPHQTAKMRYLVSSEATTKNNDIFNDKVTIITRKIYGQTGITNCAVTNSAFKHAIL